jgi:hypothetical protein
MMRTAARVAVGVALCAAAPLAAQVSLEVRGGAAVGNASQALAGMDFSPRPAFGAGVSMPAVGPLSVYASYTRASFGCEAGFCVGRDVTFTSHGVSGGVRVQPLPRLPWLQAGVLYNGLSTRSNVENDSGEAGLGYEFGAGYAVPVTPQISIVPALTYRRHEATSGGVEGHAALVSGEIGVRYTFGRR